MSEAADLQAKLKERLKVWRDPDIGLAAFAKDCLKILDKHGKLVPLEFNDAQMQLHAFIEDQRTRTGLVRVVGLKGRRQGFCLAPTTRVLTADLRWVAIDDLTEGDEVVACDENPTMNAPGGCRKMRTATITKKWDTQQTAYRITFNDGRSVVCSGGHRWLSVKSQTQGAWRSIDGGVSPKSKLQPGDRIRSITSPWGEGGWEDGWYAGMADGEGSFDQTGTGVTLTVHQRDNAAWRRLLSYVQRQGYDYQHQIDTREGSKVPGKGKLGNTHIHSVAVSRMDQMFRLIGQTRPERFLPIRWWEGRRMPDRGWMEIVSIEKLPEQRLVDLETSTGTFIAEGLVSHNSTYVAARYYWKATLTFGRKVYILSHEKASSEALFGMVERFQKYNPFAPTVGTDNARMLTFPGLEGSYTVATAGNQEGGRGDDINLFHGSEFGFWMNAESHFASSVQCVALLPGTEIILESTSGGPTGKFYEMFQKGKAGQDLYESVFIPWYVQTEYRFAPPPNFKLDTTAPDENNASEADIAMAYGLDDAQMYWRRLKVNELGLARFNREYPTSPDDAWSSTETDTFINPAAVLRARGRDTEPSGPLIIGVDPAGGGGDRFAVCHRRGNAVTKIEWRNKIDTLEATAWLREIIQEYKPDRVNIDSGNIGQAIITNLRAQDPLLAGIVRSVSFGSPSQSKMANKTRVGPENRRAEMWGRLKDWLEDREGCASVPNLDDLGSDLLACKQIHRTNGDWLLMSKADMKKAGLRSPDLGDALALTFASREYFPDRPREPVPAAVRASTGEVEYEADMPGSGGGWML